MYNWLKYKVFRKLNTPPSCLLGQAAVTGIRIAQQCQLEIKDCIGIVLSLQRCRRVTTGHFVKLLFVYSSACVHFSVITASVHKVSVMPLLLYSLLSASVEIELNCQNNKLMLS